MALTKVSQGLVDGGLGRNFIINGNFGVWQRATSQTSSGYGSDDRWMNTNTGSTKTHSRQAFTLGQTDVPNNPYYFSRTVVTSSAGASNHVIKLQRIEDVARLSGKTVTISFWAKADANKNIVVELVQNFGTGGTPSATVTDIGGTTCALTTSWQKFVITKTLPSVSGKTLGTDGNHFTQLNFWFDAGSDFNTRTNSLGQQDGTFDIAQVQLEEGSTATEFEFKYATEVFNLCYRYYFASTYTPFYQSYNPTGTNTRTVNVFLPIRMRAAPTISATYIGAAGFDTDPPAISYQTVLGFRASKAPNATGSVYFQFSYIADAEL